MNVSVNMVAEGLRVNKNVGEVVKAGVQRVQEFVRSLSVSQVGGVELGVGEAVEAGVESVQGVTRRLSDSQVNGVELGAILVGALVVAVCLCKLAKGANDNDSEKFSNKVTHSDPVRTGN